MRTPTRHPATSPLAAPSLAASRSIVARVGHPAAALASLAMIALLGCGSEEPTKTATPSASTKAIGGFSVAIDGQTFSIDYASGEATVEMVHKLNPDTKGYGCVTSVLVKLARKDGSCELRLRYEPVGETMRLAEGSFAAALGIRQGGVVIDTKVCEGFPGASAGGEILYTVVGGFSTLAVAPVGPPNASKQKAVLAGMTLNPFGNVLMQHKGKAFSLDLGPIRVEGDLESQGSEAVSCGVSVGTDLCPQNPTYGNKVGETVRRPGLAYSCIDGAAFDFGDFCGKPMMLMTYDHWLANPQRNPNANNFGGKDVLEGLGGLVTKYGEDIGFALVIRTGSQKVVVEDPSKPGSYTIGGPAPTLQDCADVRTAYNIPEDVVVLFDKDRALNSTEKQLIGATFTPAMLTADSKGTIVAVVPDAGGKLDLTTATAAIEAAIAAN